MVFPFFSWEAGGKWLHPERRLHRTLLAVIAVWMLLFVCDSEANDANMREGETSLWIARQAVGSLEDRLGKPLSENATLRSDKVQLRGKINDLREKLAGLEKERKWLEKNWEKAENDLQRALGRNEEMTEDARLRVKKIEDDWQTVKWSMTAADKSSSRHVSSVHAALTNQGYRNIGLIVSRLQTARSNDSGEVAAPRSTGQCVAGQELAFLVNSA